MFNIFENCFFILWINFENHYTWTNFENSLFTVLSWTRRSWCSIHRFSNILLRTQLQSSLTPRLLLLQLRESDVSKQYYISLYRLHRYMGGCTQDCVVLKQNYWFSRFGEISLNVSHEPIVFNSGQKMASFWHILPPAPLTTSKHL